MNILLDDVNNVDAADVIASSDALTEDPVSLLVSVLPLSDSRTFGIEPVTPATVVELHVKGTHLAHESM